MTTAQHNGSGFEFFLLTLTIALSIASCTKPPGKAPQVPLHLTSVGGIAIQPCDSPHTVQTIFRVKLHESFDKLIKSGSAGVDRRVRYTSNGNDTDITNEADDTIYDDDALSRDDTWTPSTQPGEVVPYSVDFTNVISSAPQWVEIKILLRSKTSDAASNLQFYQIPSVGTAPAINGATVADAHADASDICYGAVNVDNGHHRLVMTLFVHKPARAIILNPMSFNIVLVPRSGAVGTPVLIDPKILNNG